MAMPARIHAAGAPHLRKERISSCGGDGGFLRHIRHRLPILTPITDIALITPVYYGAVAWTFGMVYETDLNARKRLFWLYLPCRCCAWLWRCLCRNYSLLLANIDAEPCRANRQAVACRPERQTATDGVDGGGLPGKRTGRRRLPTYSLCWQHGGSSAPLPFATC